MLSLASQSFAGLALRIEGVGTAAGQYRFSTCAAPAWDSDALYLPTLISWPDEIGVEVDFLTGQARQTSGRFRLRQTTTLRAALYDVSPVVVGLADSAVGQSSTTILTDTTTLAGTVAHWGREAILLGTHAGSGTYTGCTRGYLGTQATMAGISARNLEATAGTIYPGLSLGTSLLGSATDIAGQWARNRRVEELLMGVSQQRI